jgi:hypothetical protein
MQSSISKVSDDELESLEAEFERMAFGDDTVARDAAKREVLAAAGYPDWIRRPRNREMKDGDNVDSPAPSYCRRCTLAGSD